MVFFVSLVAMNSGYMILGGGTRIHWNYTIIAHGDTTVPMIHHHMDSYYPWMNTSLLLDKYHGYSNGHHSMDSIPIYTTSIHGQKKWPRIQC